MYEKRDRVLDFVAGSRWAKIGETYCEIADGGIGTVPSDMFHNLRNSGLAMLALFNTYSPPEHEPGTEHETRAEADADESNP